MNYLKQKDIILPHLLFLDINMPRKTGMKALEEIRADKRLKDLSVAIYSTSSAKKDVEEALLKGANIYITKPGDFEQLKKILFKAIKLNWQYHTSGLNKENFILSI
jgi:CheY-like chemotaxis protein